MKKHVKTKTRSLARAFPRLSPAGILLATAILATGVVVGIARQKESAKAAASGTQTAAVKTDSRSYVTRNVGGQTVQIDTQSGQLKPLTQDEQRRLAEGLKELANQSTDDLPSVRHADGSVSVDLQDHFQNVAVAKTEADGSLSQSCVNNPKSGAAFFGIDPTLVGADAKAATNSPAQLHPIK